MINIILSHQNAIANQPNIIAIDGEVEVFSHTDKQTEAFKLLDISKMRKVAIPFFLKGSGSNEDLVIYKSPTNEVIITSNFSDKDEEGRLITYTFYYRNGKSANSIAKTLQNYSYLVGKSVPIEDYNTINKVLHYDSKKKIYLIIGGIVFFLLSILILK